MHQVKIKYKKINKMALTETTKVDLIEVTENGTIQISRNSANIASLHTAGEIRLDDWGYTISSNRSSNANVTVTTGGTLFMELSKEATYNVDPYTG